jgi:predicted nuclease with TOPRIM domain
VSELNTVIVQQAENFKEILRDERDSFEKINEEIKAKFSAQLSQMPLLEQKLAEISEIPRKIDSMIERLEHSNSQLYSAFAMSMGETVMKFTKAIKESGNPVERYSNNASTGHRQTNWIIVVAVVLIAIACITNTIHNVWFDKNDKLQTEQTSDVQPFEVVDSLANDSVAVVDSAAFIQHNNPNN